MTSRWIAAAVFAAGTLVGHAAMAAMPADTPQTDATRNVGASTPRPIAEERFRIAQAPRYFVVLGSSRQHRDARRRCSMFGDAYVIDTNEYPNFRNGYYSCVIGPLHRSDAEDQMWASKEAVPDAYVKPGW